MLAGARAHSEASITVAEPTDVQGVDSAPDRDQSFERWFDSSVPVDGGLRRFALYNLWVASPLSKSQVERLGERLVASDAPSDVDLRLLHELLLSRSSTLELAIARVGDHLQLAPTSRIKNTGTILEKLRRNGGSGLKSMQDLAGMRIVGTFDRRGQDEAAGRVRDLFAMEERAPKVIDRRVAPMHGYAAVHVVVFPDDAPIEVQIRTERQHEWAELFEKLADLVGRDIRYGQPPRRGWTAEEFAAMDSLSQKLAIVEYELRASTVRRALALAGWIAAVERAEFARPDDPALDVHLRQVDAALAEFRESVDEL
jgi:ppGpp synthetase/RelA/SpoT-type nucleotidyltranferase